jgi:hypothetical protein
VVTVGAYSREVQFSRIRPNTAEQNKFVWICGDSYTTSEAYARIARHRLMFKHVSTCPPHLLSHATPPPPARIKASYIIVTGAFRRVRIIAKSNHYFHHFRPSSSKNSTPTGRIFMKFYIWVFFRSNVVCVRAMYPPKHSLFCANLVVLARTLVLSIIFHCNHSIRVTNELAENVAICLHVGKNKILFMTKWWH